MCWIHSFPSRSSFFIIHNHGNLQVFKQAENTIWPTEQHLMFVLSSLHGDHPFANSQRAVALWRRLPCARRDERRGLCSCALCGTPARGPYPSMCWLALVANVCRQLGPSVGERAKREACISTVRAAKSKAMGHHPSITDRWRRLTCHIQNREAGGSGWQWRANWNRRRFFGSLSLCTSPESTSIFLLSRPWAMHGWQRYAPTWPATDKNLASTFLRG
jgi:hypothetical protein